MQRLWPASTEPATNTWQLGRTLTIGRLTTWGLPNSACEKKLAPRALRRLQPQMHVAEQTEHTLGIMENQLNEQLYPPRMCEVSKVHAAAVTPKPVA